MVRWQTGERGIALIMALILIILIVGLVSSYLAVATSNLRLTTNSHDSLQALYVAETGLAEALHELITLNMAVFKDADGNPAPAKGPYDRPYTYTGAYTVTGDQGQTIHVGDFSVVLTVLSTDVANGNAPEVTRLSSTGEFNGVRRVVEAGLMHAPNPAADHAILTAGDLTIAGNLMVYGDVHTNGAITLASDSAEIAPADPTLSDLSSPPYPGAYGGNLTACAGSIPAQCLVAGFRSVTASPIRIGSVSPEMVIAEAEKLGWLVDKRTPPAPLCTESWQGLPEHNADLTCPDGCPGKLIMVYGSAKLTGSVSGDVVIVATGDIEIGGNVTWDGISGDGSHFMIVAGGELKIAGNVTVSGILIAGGAVKGNGNAAINGAVISSDSSQDAANSFGGNLVVNFIRPADGVEDLLKKWQLISWRQVSTNAK